MIERKRKIHTYVNIAIVVVLDIFSSFSDMSTPLFLYLLCVC